MLHVGNLNHQGLRRFQDRCVHLYHVTILSHTIRHLAVGQWSQEVTLQSLIKGNCHCRSKIVLWMAMFLINVTPYKIKYNRTVFVIYFLVSLYRSSRDIYYYIQIQHRKFNCIKQCMIICKDEVKSGTGQQVHTPMPPNTTMQLPLGGDVWPPPRKQGWGSGHYPHQWWI